MRLTKKSEKLGYCLRNSHFRVNQCWNKLGQLEDIEDELGIDLITLFKTVKNGITVREEIEDKYFILENQPVLFCKNDIGYMLVVQTEHHIGGYYLKDYRKNWALAKEELL